MITVVISSFHYGHLASHCIESVLSQTKKPERVLFVDDGAGDCGHLISLYPEIEYYYREYNLGVVNNFDDMLRKVKSEYVMFLGADNWIRSDTIESFEEVINRHNPDVITYDIMVTGELKNEILNRHPNEVQVKFKATGIGKETDITVPCCIAQNLVKKLATRSVTRIRHILKKTGTCGTKWLRKMQESCVFHKHFFTIDATAKTF
jgi:glycosyltransferase involved in cell wall biosynthesis